MRHSSKGAAAVEFALILPILMVLVLGIIEFGYILFLKGTAAGAAREGARVMAITGEESRAKTASETAFSPTNHSNFTVEVEGCTPDGAYEFTAVTVVIDYESITGALAFATKGPNALVLKETGVMRCGG